MLFKNASSPFLFPVFPSFFLHSSLNQTMVGNQGDAAAGAAVDERSAGLKGE